MPKRAVAPPRQTTTTVKVLFGGKVRLLRHNQNPMLYARAFLQGRYVAARTGETAVLRAQKIAEEWFWGLRETVKAGGRIHEPLFAELVDDFIKDPTLRHEVSAGQHANYEKKWSVLRPYFEHTNVRVSQVDAAFLESLRLKRADQKTRYGTSLTANTISKDLIWVRQVLRWGKDKKNLEIVVPPMPSFAKGRFRVVKRGRPYLTGAAWKKLTRMAGLAALGAEKKSQLPRLRGRPINVERSRELYWFMLIAVGGALRTGEAYSLRWQDCEETTLRDVNGKNTAAIHARVLGKHSRSGEREDAYILYGGEHAFHEMKKAREGAAPGDRLFRYNHETGFRSLLKAAHLYHDLKSGMTRNTKSCRVTGICLRLENNPNVALRDIARWARTSVAIAEAYYDQIHPEASAARVAGFKTQEPKKQVTRRSKQEPKTDTKGKRRRTKKKPDAPSEEPS